MSILRPLRNLIWGKGLPNHVPTELDPVESPHRSQICAVVVTYNIGEAIHRCVDSIQSQVGHVLIVDNGSGESTLRELDQLAASYSVTLILNERNEGVARAYNQAVRWAQARGFQWILTLDHDSEATPGMIDKLVRGYGALESVGIRNAAIVAANPFDLNVQDYSFYAPRENGGLPLYCPEVISSGSLIWLLVFDVVGSFNEDLFIYFVDFEFSRRLFRAGYGVYICPETVFLHKEGSSRRHRFFGIDTYYDHYGKAARYYITRNTIYLMKKCNLSHNDFRVLLRRLWTDHMNILLFDEDRFPVLWFSLKGLLHGLKGRVGPLDSGDSSQPGQS
jgi:rhamnosyltransferase